MNNNISSARCQQRSLLKDQEAPVKVLASAVILVFSIAMIGALGQIIVHELMPMMVHNSAEEDITPTPSMGMDTGNVGDLFSSETNSQSTLSLEPEATEPLPLINDEQFIWTLRWTHIHLFGMNMIFLFMGPIAIGLDKSTRLRTWLVVLPFVGVFVDIAAMWLKNFVSPVFFWLHVPGGMLFGGVFIYVSIVALKEMWFREA